jgi:hypothetical protein
MSSIWEDEWEDYELDKYQFEQWLDSIEGEGTDKEKYDREMTKQEEMKHAEYPEVAVQSGNYTMTYSNN